MTARGVIKWGMALQSQIRGVAQHLFCDNTVSGSGPGLGFRFDDGCRRRFSGCALPSASSSDLNMCRKQRGRCSARRNSGRPTTSCRYASERKRRGGSIEGCRASNTPAFLVSLAKPHSPCRSRKISSLQAVGILFLKAMGPRKIIAVKKGAHLPDGLGKRPPSKSMSLNSEWSLPLIRV